MVARRALALVVAASLLTASSPSGARAAGDAAPGPAIAFGNLLLRDAEVQQLLDSVIGELPPTTVQQIEQLAELAGGAAAPQEIEQQLQLIVCSLPAATQSNVQQLANRLWSVGGIGLIAAALVRFNGHKDNPTQVPIGTPIALAFVGLGLLLLPTLSGPTGATLFVCSSTP